jgi:positive regulator of sigma E activity
VKNRLHATVGAEVTIAVSEQGLMGGAARLYLLPLLLLFAVLVVIQWLLPQQPEWQIILLSLLLTATGVEWMRVRGWFEVENLIPEITAVHQQYISRTTIKK